MSAGTVRGNWRAKANVMNSLLPCGGKAAIIKSSIKVRLKRADIVNERARMPAMVRKHVAQRSKE